ncbi:histone-lysine N-methyltransferase SETMAR-like [Octopus sinensis]|uniref:Histone-lysine N-methyltransferase SETMAR-like n=1 Tax=Octopus sinensis TaxID=2607531 RepID=A0A6P7T8Q4_9MOLL|nr:histone-lysine N-methyltransferase SETMAR-like [Octopus sinensis]
MTKTDLCLLFLHEFKLGYNDAQTAANVNRAWGEGSTSDRTVRRWFQKFRSGDERLEDEKSRGQSCSLDNEQLKAIVGQNPHQSVKEMSQALSVGIATVSHNLQKIDRSHCIAHFSQKTAEYFNALYMKFGRWKPETRQKDYSCT